MVGSKSNDKKKPTSRSSRAGLQFPVGRIHRLLKVEHACTPCTQLGGPAETSKLTMLPLLPRRAV
jgi:hypothetical protein